MTMISQQSISSVVRQDSLDLIIRTVLSFVMGSTRSICFNRPFVLCYNSFHLTDEWKPNIFSSRCVCSAHKIGTHFRRHALCSFWNRLKKDPGAKKKYAFFGHLWIQSKTKQGYTDSLSRCCAVLECLLWVPGPAVWNQLLFVSWPFYYPQYKHFT